MKKSFGGIHAVRGLDFDIYNNELVGLIGPNGCGKSTTFNAITGIIPADEGSVIFFDQETMGNESYEISRLGVSRTFQTTRLWRELTVLDNLLLPAKNQTGTKFWNNFLPYSRVKSEEDELIKKAYDILTLLEIDHMANSYAAELSGGQSKLVDIGRVLMSDPKILLLDEPVAGVARPLTEKIFHFIRKIRETQNLTILIIEHDMEFILRKGIDRILVMSSGRIIAEGSPDEIRDMQHVRDAYLGE